MSDLSHKINAALMAHDPAEKAALARAVYRDWQAGKLDFFFVDGPPERPGRPDKPELLHPTKMPKRRKAGSAGNRQALLHAVCHIELNAIDLALDMACRFGAQMPKDFTGDWLKVADDEARHFTMVNERLKEMDSFYGAMPAHDGLWESAMATAHDLPARLAIVPMVLEARGLDVTPAMIDRFEKFGDPASAAILSVIYSEEVDHVAAGTRWFKYLAGKENKDEQNWFQEKVQSYFKGMLKRPFNVEARDKANFPQDWYEPLADFI